jgi:Sulfotransferase family
MQQPEDRPPVRDPLEWVSSLCRARRQELDDLGWQAADVYLQLGGGGPHSSERHGRFGQFFNGQARTALATEGRDGQLGYWAGVPEIGAALRAEALAILARGRDARPAGDQPGDRHDPRTQALILAHNQIDLELHAHFTGAPARDRARSGRRPATPPRASGAVCVLGAPRSGTSLTARILNILGVDLGREAELMEPVEGNNASGFWEHEAIADLNEEILATLGQAPRQRWRRPPRLPHGWEDDPRLDAHRQRAQAVLAESFAERPLWGWKDPRTCLTLPFWRRALAGAERVEPAMLHVVCVRNPLDVAASLRARDEMPAAESFRLWHRYLSDAMAYAHGEPRLFVSYESYFRDGEAQAKRLAAFLGLPAPSDEQLAAIAAHVDTKLRHHRSADPGADLPPDCADLYAVLRVLAGE